MSHLLPSSCITLEEHASLPALGDSHPLFAEIYASFPGVLSRLRDLHTQRLADMDAGHVGFQIISQVTGIANLHPPSASRLANDQLAEAVARAPSRLGAFAALCMVDPSAAAAELRRAVQELGFVGAMVDNALPDGTHYDDQRFWGFWEEAERLAVPIYLHPSPPGEGRVDRFRGNYPEVARVGLATGNWGWHEDEGLHVVKLFAAGVFRRFPGLKIIIGHMGEMIPMMIDRIDDGPFFRRAGLGRFRDVWERNVWVTTSGMFSVRTLEMLLKVTPLERVLYSVDAPFKESVTGWRFVEEIAESGLMSKEELELFVAGNARKLFGKGIPENIG